MTKIRVGVVGAGQFGKNHARVVSGSSRAKLVAVVDTDPVRARQAAEQHGCEALGHFSALDGKVDAAIVAVPTTLHSEVGCGLIRAGIDILVEKPIAPSADGAEQVIQAARENGRILQVGHLERFNPAVKALESAATLPLFFEVHRLSEFSPRSLDVDVVLDLMIHDLDIVLNLVKSTLVEVRAAGISILSGRVDIANVRLEFKNGCVANLTASRVSTERVRKLRLFQPGQYISLDYSKQGVLAISVDRQRKIGFAELPVVKAEPLALQFDSFLDSVASRNPPKVTGESALETLRVALGILAKIEEHGDIVSRSLVSGWKL